MRLLLFLLFIASIIGGIVWYIPTPDNLKEFQDLLEILKWPAIICVVGIVLREINLETGLIGRKKRTHLIYTPPINHDG